MSDNRFGPLEPIGQTPEWQEWIERAFAEIMREQLDETEWNPRAQRMIGIQPISFKDIVIPDERARVGHELVPLVRAAVRDYTVGRHPWGFTP